MTAAAGLIGVVVAGGRGTRMGGSDKALLPIAGRPMLAYVLDRLAPQVDHVVINAGGDPDRFADFGLPVVADDLESGRGPLAGVVAAMRWAAERDGSAPHVLTVPCDTPFLPRDLVSALRSALRRSAAEIACAASAGRTHPLCALWPVALASRLAAALDQNPSLGVARWMYQNRVVEVTFPVETIDPFLNVNSPEDLRRAEELVQALIESDTRIKLRVPSGSPSGRTA
jgi:molybdopterin-guanine dinucleotide biosynthesis protein A